MMAPVPSHGVEPTPSDIPSADGFRVGLYLEHLEEAAALWEQRPADRANPELSWLDLGEEEGRLEAHLDALLLGGDLALAVCRQQALEADDPGQLHAALRIFCRQGRSDLVNAAIEAIDPDDEEALDAMSDALTAELPETWEAGALRRDLLADPRRLRLATDLVVQRRLPARDALLDALPTAEGGSLARVVRALGRTPQGAAPNTLGPLFTHDNPAVRLEAGVALLRSGEAQVEQRVLPAVRTDPALVRLLALAGRGSAVPWLATVLGHPTAGDDAAHTLGLLGDPAAVLALIDALPGPNGEAAATALTLLTGAEITDDVFVEDVPEDDELFDDERERLEAGEPLVPPETVPPGQEPRGTTLVLPSTDPETWRAWWEANREAFEDAERYRLGRPAGPESQVASLAAPFVPHALRGWIAEELAARYRMPLAFSTLWSVARQQAALREMEAWAAEQRFVPGRYYVAAHYAG